METNKGIPSLRRKAIEGNLVVRLVLFVTLIVLSGCDLGGVVGRQLNGGTGGAGQEGGIGSGTGVGGGGTPEGGLLGSSLLIPGGIIYHIGITHGLVPWEGTGVLYPSDRTWEENHPIGNIENGRLVPVSRPENPSLTLWIRQYPSSNSGITISPSDAQGFAQFDFRVLDSEQVELGTLSRVVLDIEGNTVQQVYYWYASEPVLLSGSFTDFIEEGSYSVTIDASLQVGWNRVIATFSYREEQTIVSYSTGPEPEGTIWLFIPTFLGHDL